MKLGKNILLVVPFILLVCTFSYGKDISKESSSEENSSSDSEDTRKLINQPKLTIQRTSRAAIYREEFVKMPHGKRRHQSKPNIFNINRAPSLRRFTRSENKTEFLNKKPSSSTRKFPGKLTWPKNDYPPSQPNYKINEERPKRSPLVRELQRPHTNFVPYTCHQLPCIEVGSLPNSRRETHERHQFPQRNRM